MLFEDDTQPSNFQSKASVNVAFYYLTSLLAAAGVFAFCSVTAAFAADSASSLKQGISNYERGKFEAASVSLSAAVNKDPYNPISHYYLANTFLQLHDKSAAIKEYASCFSLDPFGLAGQYSRDALVSLQASPVASSAREDKNRVALDTAKSVRQAVTCIDKQTNEKGKSHQVSGQISARIASDAATVQAEYVTRQANDLVAEITAANPKLPPNVQDDLEDIRQKALHRASWIREDAQQQAHRRVAMAARHSEYTEKAASNLMALIAENPKAGHVKVKAAGTNLYVRNYGFESRPELKAEWKSVSENHVSVQ